MQLAALIVILPLMLISYSANAIVNNCQPVSENSNDLIIGEIKLLNSNIFDPNNPDENSTIHKIANTLHIQTRQATIRQQLLFQVGDVYNQQKIDETERILRSKSYLHTASIYPSDICNGQLVVIVKTSDNWTLTPSISVGRSGGITRTSVEIAESNLFGLGKDIKYQSESNEDRDSRFLEYRDDNLFGSHYKLFVKTAENSDGYFDAISIAKPFYHLDARQALSLNTSREKKQIAIYENGLIVDTAGQLTESLNAEFGWSDGLHDEQVFRYKLGWQATDNQFFNVEDYPDSILPVDSQKHFPYIGVEYLQDLYIQRENFTTCYH